MRKLAFICILLIGCNKALEVSSPVDVPQDEQKIIEDSNNERVKRGLEPLVINEKLIKSARLHARHMAESNKLSHVLSRYSDSRTLKDRLALSEYKWSMCAENIAWNYDLDMVVEGWMNSSG